MALKYPINIVLADDDELIREGFTTLVKKIPQLKLLGIALNGSELIELTRRLKPDVIFTDIRMPLVDGIQATKIISKEFPKMGIIALSMFDEYGIVAEIIEAGAKGYLLKNTDKKEILEASMSVFTGDYYYSKEINEKMARMIAKKVPEPSQEKKLDFSEIEKSIIGFICKGFSNKKIASEIHISSRTVEWHRRNILEKADVKNTAALVVYSMQQGIYKPG